MPVVEHIYCFLNAYIFLFYQYSNLQKIYYQVVLLEFPEYNKGSFKKII